MKNYIYLIFSNLDILKYGGAYHALSFIYIYGLTSEVKLHLIKAEHFLKKIREKEEYSQPYYTRLILKLRKNYLNLVFLKIKGIR